MLTLDPIQTVAFAGAVLMLGYGVLRAVPALGRWNVPAPVVGGLIVAMASWAARENGVTLFEFDVVRTESSLFRYSLRDPLMIAFFTAIGFGASLSLLKAGGPQVIVCLMAATFFAAVQNAVGIPLAKSLGAHPLFGVIVGSVTLAGGPATGLAFAKSFAAAGVPATEPVALASAMAGILMASLFGGPLGTWLIERHRLSSRSDAGNGLADQPNRTGGQAASGTQSNDAKASTSDLLKSVVLLLLAMWIGSWLSRGLSWSGIKLPAYIGAMIVAAVLRNLDDGTGWLGLSVRTLDQLGQVALSLFLTLALMTLKLWELSGLAVPLVVILAVQAVLMIAASVWPIFPLMGRDYDAAVMSSGFCGFMLGTTANAMANMTALVERYGPAPRAFLVVPIVGAFFIDFTNALLITFCLNVWGT